MTCEISACRRAVRGAVGEGVDIMLDCILSGSSGNSLLYAIKLARSLEPYLPTWLEEPLNTDDLDAYDKLAASTQISLASSSSMAPVLSSSATRQVTTRLSRRCQK